MQSIRQSVVIPKSLAILSPLLRDELDPALMLSYVPAGLIIEDLETASDTRRDGVKLAASLGRIFAVHRGHQGGHFCHGETAGVNK